MEAILATCNSLIANDNGVFVSILLAGLLGSLVHCSVLCGPLVAAQSLMLQTQNPSASAHAMLWYHAGRIGTYMFLGAVAATGSARIFGGGEYPALTSALLLLAGGVFIFSAVKPKAAHGCQCNTGFLNRLRLPVAAQLTLRGIILGFMPCGMVFAALMLVVTTRNPLTGALAMLLFGLGTLPLLQLLGYGSSRAAKRWKPAMNLLGRSAMTLNGIILCSFAVHAF